MAKKAKTYGEFLVEGMEEAVGIARGRSKPAKISRVAITARDVAALPPPKYSAARVRSIRKRMNLSQTVFAAALNVSPATVRGWERGARVPDGPSRRLLELADRYPETLLTMLVAS